MKIIISGTVDIDPEQMDAAMKAAKPLIEGALTQEGIMDYDWCPDPLTPAASESLSGGPLRLRWRITLIITGIKTCAWR